jgi:hypothetical protein
LFPLFTTGVIDTGGKVVASVVNTGGELPPAANLLPVSLTSTSFPPAFVFFAKYLFILFASSFG